MIVLQILGGIAGIALVIVAILGLLWWGLASGDRNPFE